MWRDLRQAARPLLRRWPSSVVTILLIGAGVACCSALFAVIDGLLFKPLPFPRQEELLAVRVKSSRTREPVPMTHWQVGELQRLGTLQAAGYSRYANSGDRSRDTLQVAAVSPDFFRVLGVGAHVGRLLDSTDSTDGGMVVAYATWRTRFGANPFALGSRLEWNGRPYTLIGVAPPAVDFPYGADAWVLSTPPTGRDTGASLEVIARLPTGMSAAQASALYPQYALMPLRDYLKPGGTFALVLLLVAAMLVLAVAWVQVAAMQIARAAERRRDTRVRLALGATTGHIVRSAAAEGCWLGLGALTSAVALTPFTLQFILRQLPPALTTGQQISLDGRVLAFVCGASVVGVVAFAVAPLWRSSRAQSLSARPNQRRISRARQVLVVTQVAVAVPLIYLAGLAWLSSTRLLRQDLGFRPQGLYVVKLPRLPATDRAALTGALADSREKFTKIAAAPGVLGVSAGGDVPFGGRTAGALTLSGTRGGDEMAALISGVEPTFFATMGIRLASGRTFLATDGADSPLVAVVNATVASRLRAMGRDVGAQILILGRPATVVGVVADTRDTVHPSAPPESRVYLASDQWIPPGFMFVRLDPKDPAAHARLATQVRELWRDAGARPASVEDLVASASTDHRGRSTLLALLAAAAIGMTLLGIYGAVSAVTRDRTAEIAIRIISGAHPVGIATQIVLSAVRWVTAGVVIGLLAGWAVARATSALLFETGAFDGPLVAGVAVTLVLGALISAVIPALRAAALQPAVALREN